MKGFLLVHINLVSLMVGKCGSGDDTIRSRGKAFSTVGLGNVGKHPIIFFFFFFVLIVWRYLASLRSRVWSGSC